MNNQISQMIVQNSLGYEQQKKGFQGFVGKKPSLKDKVKISEVFRRDSKPMKRQSTLQSKRTIESDKKHEEIEQDLLAQYGIDLDQIDGDGDDD